MRKESGVMVSSCCLAEYKIERDYNTGTQTGYVCTKCGYSCSRILYVRKSLRELIKQRKENTSGRTRVSKCCHAGYHFSHYDSKSMGIWNCNKCLAACDIIYIKKEKEMERKPMLEILFTEEDLASIVDSTNDTNRITLVGCKTILSKTKIEFSIRARDDSGQILLDAFPTFSSSEKRSEWIQEIYGSSCWKLEWAEPDYSQ